MRHSTREGRLIISETADEQESNNLRMAFHIIKGYLEKLGFVAEAGEMSAEDFLATSCHLPPRDSAELVFERGDTTLENPPLICRLTWVHFRARYKRLGALVGTHVRYGEHTFFVRGYVASPLEPSLTLAEQAVA